MPLETTLYATVVIAVAIGAAFATSQINVTEPSSEESVYAKNSNIDVTAQTWTTYRGSTVALKIRADHVSDPEDESGTILQSDSATVNNEGIVSETASAPSGGWPTQLGANKPVHAEAKITVNNNTYLDSQNSYIEAEYP